MEHIIQEIKTSFSTCTPDELQARIPIWRDQFRNKGISITALETLLNFFQEPHPTGTSGADEAFVDPHLDERVKDFRSIVSRMERDNTELKRQAAKWRTFFFVALAAIILLFICVAVIVVL
jgi:hypothetical protein